MKLIVSLLSFALAAPAFAGPVRLGQCVGGKPTNGYCTGMVRFNIRRGEDGTVKIGAYDGSTNMNSFATWTVKMTRKGQELRFTDVKGSNLDLRIALSKKSTYHGVSHPCVSKEHKEFKGSAGLVTAYKKFPEQDLNLRSFPVVCQWYADE